MLEGKLRVTATDGEAIEIGPGGVILLSDVDREGHLSQVQGTRDMRVLLIGLDENAGWL
jgi:uncharacterized cupin superfamily protein